MLKALINAYPKIPVPPVTTITLSFKEKIFYTTGNRPPYEKKSTITQQRVDELLDKISQKGYHFLTDEEKEFLKRASKEG